MVYNNTMNVFFMTTQVAVVVEDALRVGSVSQLDQVCTHYSYLLNILFIQYYFLLNIPYYNILHLRVGSVFHLDQVCIFSIFIFIQYSFLSSISFCPIFHSPIFYIWGWAVSPTWTKFAPTILFHPISIVIQYSFSSNIIFCPIFPILIFLEYAISNLQLCYMQLWYIQYVTPSEIMPFAVRNLKLCH